MIVGTYILQKEQNLSTFMEYYAKLNQYQNHSQPYTFSIPSDFIKMIFA